MLVVVVAAGGHVSHKVIDPSEEYDQVELQQAANYLNSEFKGRSLLEVRQAVLERLREERTLYDELMARALRLASTTFEDIDSEPTVFIQGTSLLLEDVGGEDPEVTLETLRTLLRMIEEKTRLVQLLDDYISSDGLTIVIGTEHHAPDLQRFSLVASTYSDGHGTGAVGVIGPTRMRYSRAINAVESLSKAITPDGQFKVMTTGQQHSRYRRARLSSRDEPPHPPPSPTPLRDPSASATSTTTCCSASPPSSTTTASAPTASVRRVGDAAAASMIDEICCRSSTISSARCRRSPAATPASRTAAASS